MGTGIDPVDRASARSGPSPAAIPGPLLPGGFTQPQLRSGATSAPAGRTVLFLWYRPSGRVRSAGSRAGGDVFPRRNGEQLHELIRALPIPGQSPPGRPRAQPGPAKRIDLG